MGLALFALASACSGHASGDDLFADGGAAVPPDDPGTGGPGTGGPGTGGPGGSSASAIVVELQTDMATPRDFDFVHVEVISGSTVQYSYEFDTPSFLKLPASLSLCASDSRCGNAKKGTIPPGKISILTPTSPLVVRFIGRFRGKHGEALFVRSVRTTLPTGRVARLAIVAEEACAGWANDPSPGVVTSDCGDDQTCIAGACASIDVDSATLPTEP